MNTHTTDIEVIRNRVRNTADYSGTWYEGDRPNLNWSNFLMFLEWSGRLSKTPSFRSTIKTAKRY